MLETGCYEQCAHANGRQPNLTATEYKTEFSMWAISASPLQITTTIMNCSQPTLPSCSVTLDQQLSKAKCTPGVSFGCAADNSSMWTAFGCRGDFTCNGHKMTCDVNATGVNTCACPGAPAVTCKGWLSDLQKEILLNVEVIGINQDVTPQGRPVKDGDLTVWARGLSDGSQAVALYNQEDAPASIGVDFASLGWAGATVKGRDLWQHADVGPFVSSIPPRVVAPHETVLFRLYKQ